MKTKYFCLSWMTEYVWNTNAHDHPHGNQQGQFVTLNYWYCQYREVFNIFPLQGLLECVCGQDILLG